MCISPEKRSVLLLWILVTLLNIYRISCFSITRESYPHAKRTDDNSITQHDSNIPCVYMETKDGDYWYTSEGHSSAVCGLFLIGEPDQLIEIEFLDFNIGCKNGNVMGLLDGWEVTGSFFPSVQDYTGDISNLYRTFCGDNQPERIWISAANVALIQYRLPTAGAGFRVRVRFINNVMPCNVISMFDNGTMTIKNYGLRSNCSVSLLYPERVEIISMDVGQTKERPALNVETGLIEECHIQGSSDYLELLDGEGLDPTTMWKEASLCGLSSYPKAAPFDLGCHHSVIRLVSSGSFYNSATFSFRKLTLEEQIQMGELEC